MERRPSQSERPTLPCPRGVDAGGGADVTRSHDTRSHDNGRESARVLVGERRRLFRVRAELEVSIGVDAHFFTVSSVNLSPDGLLVSTFRALPRGLGLSVEFDLPASRVVAQGEVRWSREASPGSIPGYGIAFTDLSRFDRTLIESFCARLAPEAYPRLAPSAAPRSFDRRLAG